MATDFGPQRNRHAASPGIGIRAIAVPAVAAHARHCCILRGETMTNTPPPRRLAALAAGFGVALAVPMIGLSSTLPMPGPALADCTLGFIDNPATPGQCVPIPGEGQERTSADPAPAPDNPDGSDLSACDLSEPYPSTVCPGAPAAPGQSTGVEGSTEVTAPVPGDNTSGPDRSACDLAQPYQNPLCP